MHWFKEKRKEKKEKKEKKKRKKTIKIPGENDEIENPLGTWW